MDTNKIILKKTNIAFYCFLLRWFCVLQLGPGPINLFITDGMKRNKLLVRSTLLCPFFCCHNQVIFRWFEKLFFFQFRNSDILSFSIMTHSHLVLYLPAYLGLNSVNKNVLNLFQENAHGFAPLYLIAKCIYWIERTVALWKDCT